MLIPFLVILKTKSQTQYILLRTILLAQLSFITAEFPSVVLLHSNIKRNKH